MFEAAQSTPLQHLFCSLPEGCYGNSIFQSSLVWDNVLPARSAHVLCAEVRGTARGWGCLGTLVFSLALGICRFFLGFAVLLALVEVMMCEVAVIL